MAKLLANVGAAHSRPNSAFVPGSLPRSSRWSGRSIHTRVERRVSDCKRSSQALADRYTYVAPVDSMPLTTFHLQLANHAALPGTVNRVETHVSHRKQTIAHASTRNVPAHAKFRKNLASEKLKCSAGLSSPAGFPHARLGLQSCKGAPKISAFMEFFGETGTVFKPGAARWASLFMGGFSAEFRPSGNACTSAAKAAVDRSPATARLKSCPDEMPFIQENQGKETQ
jgi:hypothetical protein